MNETSVKKRTRSAQSVMFQRIYETINNFYSNIKTTKNNML